MAFLAKELTAGKQPWHVRTQLAAALAVSATDVGTDALVQLYKDTEPTKRLTILDLMSNCPTARMATFLADEFERETGADNKRYLLTVLNTLLAGPLR